MLVIVWGIHRPERQYFLWSAIQEFPCWIKIVKMHSKTSIGFLDFANATYSSENNFHKSTLMMIVFRFFDTGLNDETIDAFIWDSK